jgi:hypothetical protein
MKQGDAMNNYSAFFFTDSNYAEYEIEADTPEQALATARALDEADDLSLYFESYDSAQPVDEITIRDQDGEEVATWMSDALRLRLAAEELLDAAELALRELRGFYSDGESEAVRVLAVAIAKAKPSGPAA